MLPLLQMFFLVYCEAVAVCPLARQSQLLCTYTLAMAGLRHHSPHDKSGGAAPLFLTQDLVLKLPKMGDLFSSTWKDPDLPLCHPHRPSSTLHYCIPAFPALGSRNTCSTLALHLVLTPSNLFLPRRGLREEKPSLDH